MEGNSKLYDFIIIGCGPTGAAAATYLTRLGYSVMVFERTKFPRQHEGESLLPFCYPLFKELGVYEEMKTKFVKKPGVRFLNYTDTASATYCFQNIISDESKLSFHVLRSEFDLMLMNNAIKNGAEVMQETKVEKVDLQRPDKIVDVVTVDTAGNRTEWKAKFLIDASGQDTFLAKRSGAKTAYKELDRTAFLTHWEDGAYTDGIDVGLLQLVYLNDKKSGWFGIQPIGKNRLSVGLVINRQYLKEQKKLLLDKGVKDWQMAFYRQEVEECAFTKKILADARIVQPLLIVSDYSYYTDKPWGDNYALLGDAGKFLDPIFASGVYLGMNSAKMFAEAIHTKLSLDVNAGDAHLENAYKHITGAYDLVEKFVHIFYDPNSFNLAEVDPSSESKYKNYETAFSLVHYLLAGDFFNNYDKYSGFLDMLRNPDQFQRWKSLLQSRPSKNNATCDSSYNEIFGDIIDALVPPPPGLQEQSELILKGAGNEA
ncbi:MAG: tryptophan 7-halogenase [Bacteroidetes bacterium]|nr:tryptophan 7-halogenase [Bacteroidota bacterium]